CVATLVAGFW
nr:immunoglobulin heavy chain junction region [Mus musculus]NSM03891.1 immunoglobulin heavy chain junction region [Mus musculus]NSM04533.1 immunoglobulin heavy chain junction region [Mus musculus]NSM04676.1 immunoglobulin heavy chain junction region [Mus musculus]NSM04826.1 immunoglobulin heavy chain junction region [Mus musculus]